MKNLIRISLVAALASALAPAFAANIEVVSRPFAPLPRSIGDSLGLHLSADGRWAAFTSSANGLLSASGETTPSFSLNAYLKNLESGEVLLLSRNSDGQKADGDSVATDISSDGRFVVFESDASDLVFDDTNATSDIFLFDHASNALTRVSTSVEVGGATNELADATGASLTRDGRYVFYEAQVDANAYYFRFDRTSGNTVPAVTGPNGEPWPSILDPSPSDDGRFVAFRSTANLLAPQAANEVPQLFLHDIPLRTNYWLSLASTGNPELSPTNGPAAYVSDARISQDSREIAFVASELAEPLNPSIRALYLYSIETGVRSKIPLPEQVQASLEPQVTSFDISADVQTVAYTLAHRPEPGANAYLPAQLYFYDRSFNTNRVLTTSPGEAFDAQISDDGNRVVFTKVSDSVLAGISRENPQLYTFDRESGSTQLISRSASGDEADEPVLNVAISADGSLAGFETLASTLSTNDDPTGFDLFSVNLSGTTSPQLLSAPYNQAISSTAAGNSDLAALSWSFYRQSGTQMSADGQRALLLSSAPDLAPEDPFSDLDLFLADLTGQPATRISNASDVPGEKPSLIDASADLNRILFSEGDSLYLFDRNTASVTPAAILPDGSVGRWDRPTGDLSVDGRYLLFAAFLTNSGSITDWQLCVRDLEKLETRVVPDAQDISLYPYLNQMSDGGRYVLNPVLNGTQLIDLQTGEKSTLADRVAAGSAWDDSILLLARRGQDGRAAELWTYNPLSHETNLVATNTSFQALSGDGSIVVYSQTLDNHGRSFVYDIATATTTPLTVDGRDFLFEQTPALTPDGRFIAFTIDTLAPDVTPPDHLYVFDRTLTTLTTVAAPDGSPIQHLQRYAISADGRTVVFDSADDQLVANDRNRSTDTFIIRLDLRDTDNDSLEDGWEIRHFGTLAHGASADADADGIPNGLEFQTGTDPQDAASKFTLSATLIAEDRLTLEWPSALGKTYQLQKSTTLAPGSWTDFGPPVTAFNSTARVIVSASDRSFYRAIILN